MRVLRSYTLEDNAFNTRCCIERLTLKQNVITFTEFVLYMNSALNTHNEAGLIHG